MARVARQMEAQAAQKAIAQAADAPASNAPADALSPSPNVTTPRLGDALIALAGAAAGPIDPTFLLMAQQAYTEG